MDSDRPLRAVDGSLRCQRVWNRRLRGSLTPSGPVLSVLAIKIFQCTADLINWDSDWVLPGHGNRCMSDGCGEEGREEAN